MEGNKYGYDIGVDKEKLLDKNNRNLPTNVFEKIAITEWITKGVAVTKNIFGPFESQSEVVTQCEFKGELELSPMGAVPKEVDLEGNIVKYRPIIHMSAPRGGNSVSSCIPKDNKDVKYIQFMDVCQMDLVFRCWSVGLDCGC